MPSLSLRAERTPASPIRRLVPYANAAKQRGITIHHLNIGQPDIETPSQAVEAMKQGLEPVIAYSPSAGFDDYRLALAQAYEAQYQIPKLQADDFIICNGGSEALWFAMLACFNPGDALIVPEPFYANYNGFAESLGVVIQPITSTLDQGFALPNIESFEAAVTSRTKGILICNPGNPTGYLYSKAELEQLADIAKRHDLYLIADEVYRDFIYDGQSHYSILNIEGLEEQAVVIDSISKRYSACGARLGMLISRNKTLMQACLKFAQARLSPSTLAQVLGHALLETPASYFDNIRQTYDLRRRTLIQRLQAMRGVRCPYPQGAFYVMVELPIDDTDRFCQWLLESFDHQGETLMMAPGTGFYTTESAGRKQARLAYVLDVPVLHRAMDCLEKALEAYPHRQD